MLNVDRFSFTLGKPLQELNDVVDFFQVFVFIPKLPCQYCISDIRRRSCIRGISRAQDLGETAVVAEVLYTVAIS